eukprot:735904-Amphidinium_carterae.1
MPSKNKVKSCAQMRPRNTNAANHRQGICVHVGLAWSLQFGPRATPQKRSKRAFAVVLVMCFHGMADAEVCSRGVDFLREMHVMAMQLAMVDCVAGVVRCSSSRMQRTHGATCGNGTHCP